MDKYKMREEMNDAPKKKPCLDNPTDNNLTEHRTSVVQNMQRRQQSRSGCSTQYRYADTKNALFCSESAFCVIESNKIRGKAPYS